MTKLRTGTITLALLVLVGCSGGGQEEAVEASAEAVPNVGEKMVDPLQMEAVSEGPLSEFFAKRIDVFGVPVVASEATPDDKVWHAASVMAEYLDNDEDGVIDNPALVDTMVEEKAMLIMFADFEELEGSGLFQSSLRDEWRMQDCEGHETNPEEGFDAALEEVMHLISHVGYAELYPEAFSEAPGSRLGDAMDIARGGQFDGPPAEYPEGAWYTYDDETCDYNCMAAEYFYWSLTTILGAQSDPDRCEWISREWRPCTPDQIAEMDVAVYELMTDPQYALPTTLPDGKYR